MLMKLIFHAFRTRAEKLDVIALAFRATLRDALCMSAVMAEHATVAPMIGKAYRAIHARQTLAARAADHETREPAAIQQQHHLLSIRQPLADFFAQQARKRRLLLCLQKLAAHVDNFHTRQRAAADALRHVQANVLAFFGVVAAFDARRGGPEYRYCPRLPRANESYVAAVISRRFLLLIASVVLFIYDQQTQILHRSKHAGSRTYYYTRLPGLNAAPLAGALCVAERGMKNRHLVAEAMKELAGDGGRERNLRHQ